MTVGFEFLVDRPTVSKRRYCNKVLVHECVGLPEIAPTSLDRVEFIATSDPCYKVFEIYKTSEATDDIDATIEIQLNDDDLAVGAIVSFLSSETCDVSGRMAYKLIGYDEDGVRIILAQGNMYTTPCACQECREGFWTNVDW